MGGIIALLLILAVIYLLGVLFMLLYGPLGLHREKASDPERSYEIEARAALAWPLGCVSTKWYWQFVYQAQNK